MNFRFHHFESVDPGEWDSWVLTLRDSTYLHSSLWVGFCHFLLPSTSRKSFALLDTSGVPLALCPLGISTIEYCGRTFYEASWNGAPLGIPAIQDDDPPQRRRLVREVFDVFHEQLRAAGVSKSVLARKPISLRVLNGDAGPIGQLEALASGYACQMQNTIVLDLRLTEDELRRGMTQEQRKHLLRSQAQGISVGIFHGNATGLEEMHVRYCAAHRTSARCLTRPQESFDYMLKMARSGQATLFVGFVEGVPASFLYCGEFHNSAFGWSQVNIDEFEERYSLRHLLEWSAVLFYKRRSFQFYELGTRWYGPQLYTIPTAKELSIAFMKERYGGQLWPDLVFERFFDRDLFCHFHQCRLEAFLKSTCFHQGELCS